MSLRKYEKKIPDSELVVYYDNKTYDPLEALDAMDLMAKRAISAKRKYVNFIIDANSTKACGRVVMILKPAKKEEEKKKK